MKKILCVLTLLIFGLTGCGINGDEMVYLLTKSVESMDPVDASYSQTFQLMSDIYLMPTKIDGNRELVMGGAKSIDISDDGLTYTINLRDDVDWVDSSGKVVGHVTANDYVYAYQRMVDPKEASVFSYIFEVIDNASEIMADEVEPGELAVNALDDYTLEIKLDHVAPYFESMLTLGSFAPQSKEAVEEFGDDYGTSADTTWYNGAYYVTDYQPDYEIHLVKNESYYRADEVEVPAINFRLNEDSSSRYYAYLNDEADYAEITNPEDYNTGIADGTIEDKMTSYSNYLVLNYDDSAVTSNENLRQALAYGFDRETILSGVYGEINQPLEYIIPADLTTTSYDGVDYHDYSDDSLTHYDQEKANEYFDKYMDEMGYTDRNEIKISLLASADANGSSKFAEVVQSSYLQNFGITVDLDVQPFEQFLDSRRQGAFDMYLQSWGPDYADPSTYLSLWQTSQIGSQNHAKYSNEAYDELYRQAINEQDTDVRFTDFASLEKMLVDDAIAIPFYQLNSPVAINDEYNIPLDSYNSISHEYVTINGGTNE